MIHRKAIKFLILHIFQHSIEVLQKDIYMMFLENQGRSETDTAGPTCTHIDSSLTETIYHFVSGSYIWQVNWTKGSQPSSIPEIAWVLFLKVIKNL